MASGATVVGSRTAPVEEVINDGVNGFLVDFFDHEGLADAVTDACVARDELLELRRRAVATVRASFDLQNRCLSDQVLLIVNSLIGRRREDVADGVAGNFDA
jgi:glycosyltransferase involved in cell wall biosynthesis